MDRRFGRLTQEEIEFAARAIETMGMNFTESIELIKDFEKYIYKSSYSAEETGKALEQLIFAIEESKDSDKSDINA